MIEHEYSDWKVHFETCPLCTRLKPCPEGQRLLDTAQRDARRGK